MLARFKTSKKRPACSDTLGMDLAEVHQDEMRVVVNFTAHESFANPTGAIQGGFIAAMLDEAISTNIIIASNVTMTAPTLEMKVSYLAPLFVGDADRARFEHRWMRLQHTVEGLSVVAISYYAVSLAGYLLYPLTDVFGVSKGMITAIATLPVVAAVWFMVRNIRNVLQRAHLTEQEVRTLRGIITSLAGNRRP